MIQLRIRAQHDLEADVARFGGIAMRSNRVSDAPSSSTSSARTWPLPENSSASGASTTLPLGTRSATPPRANASDAALTALPRNLP